MFKLAPVLFKPACTPSQLGSWNCWSISFFIHNLQINGKKKRNIIKQSFVAAQGKKSCHTGRSKFTLWHILSRLIQWVCFNFNPLSLSSPIARLQDFLQSASKQSEQAYRSYSKSKRSRLIKLFDLSMRGAQFRERRRLNGTTLFRTNTVNAMFSAAFVRAC